ncbi:MAG: SoxR reducing system RseC family protein [Succinivibrionaceae bacterium]
MNMYETLAVVTKNMDNGYVECSIGTKGLCGSCQSKTEECSSNIFDSKLESKRKDLVLENLLGAKLGQIVRIGFPTKSIILSIIISYMLPLLFLIIGAILGFLFLDFIVVNKNFASIIGCFVGLFIGVIVSVLTARICIKTIWKPRILGILPIQNSCNKAK